MVESAEEGEIPKLTDESYINKPETLRNICIQTVCDHHFQTLFYPKHIWNTTPVTLRKDTQLPAILADDILHYLLKHTSLPIESILSAFSDSSKCSLNEFHLQNVDIGYHALLELSNEQKPQRIEIYQVKFLEITGHECLLLKFLNDKTRSFFIGPKVSTKAKVRFECLSRKKFPYLKSLRIVCNKLAWYLLIDPADPVALTTLELSCYMNPRQPEDVKREAASNKTFFNRISEDEQAPGSRVFPPFARFDSSGDAPDTPMLGDVTLDDMQLIEKCDNFMEDDMLEDISSEYKSPLLPRYRLELMKSSLLSLTLYSNCLGPDDFKTIFCLKQLRHLDVGVYHQDVEDGVHGHNNRPDLTVYQIMDALPNLESLDVSSTEIGDRLYKDALSKPISGERFVPTPVKRRLEFLGLFETEGCEISNIHMLARNVTGFATELQMMTGIEHYMNRAEMSAVCYNHMYALNRNQPLSCPHKLLRLLLESMDRHPTNDRLLLTCTANFFFLTRRYCTTYSKQQKQSIILAIVKCLESNHLEHQVVRNSLLTLYHFDLPGDLVFSFLRITRVILKTFEQHQNNPDVNAIAVHMCNTLVSLEHDMKKEVSKIDFVLTILNVIKQRLENEQCDEVMEVCWSTLWNVTDETPKNSSDFIALKGLDILQECFKAFPDHLELHKNIMGLVGNIAEVKELRSCLREKERIDTFRLLMNRNNNIEVAYNSCGTLAHLMSDRDDAARGLTKAERDVISNEMYEVIEKWDINATRNINYRSFKPILQLLYSGVGESIHWACWALCNLSGLDERYVILMHKEDGRKYIEPVLPMQGLREKTKELARTLIDRLKAYERRIETSHEYVEDIDL